MFHVKVKNYDFIISSIKEVHELKYGGAHRCADELQSLRSKMLNSRSMDNLYGMTPYGPLLWWDHIYAPNKSGFGLAHKFS